MKWAVVLVSAIEGVGKGLLARICSRPGQTGRVDGYVLEGIELEFYLNEISSSDGIFCKINFLLSAILFSVILEIELTLILYMSP